jgi:serine/threonine-protein kinase RsbW
MPTMIFPGRYSSLEKIAEFVTKEARESHFSENEVCCIETAVDEACSNIIEHAYKGEDIGEIECIVDLIPDGIIIALKDKGCPFDIKGYKPPNLKTPLRNRKTHGLGLYFIRQMMDKVELSNDGSTNVLVLTKYRETHPDAKKTQEQCIG